MLRAIQKKLKNKKGFTLVELIVVIAILGVLSAVAIPRFNGIMNSSERGVDEANAAMIARQIETAFLAGDLTEGSSNHFESTKAIDIDDTADKLGDHLVDLGYLDAIPALQDDRLKSPMKATITITDGDITKILITDSSTTPVELFDSK